MTNVPVLHFCGLDPLDFLAAVGAHLPDAHEKTTAFYGWYCNRARGTRGQHRLLGKGVATAPVPGMGYPGPLEVHHSWARRIGTVYEVDPLLGPHCGGTMQGIAVMGRAALLPHFLHLGPSPLAPRLQAPPDRPEGPAAHPSRP